MSRSALIWRNVTRSDTGRAAGLAAAMIASNVLGLVFTVVFARILGASDYGSLAALVSAWIILMVPGSALQIAVAREVSRATAEQKRGGDDVVKAMAEILETARRNLSSVEETARASADLARQAEELATLTAAFRAK